MRSDITNATTVLYGTAWTSETLLARTIQYLQQQQTRDGVRRVFQYDAGQVAAYVPAYGRCAQHLARRGHCKYEVLPEPAPGLE